MLYLLKQIQHSDAVLSFVHWEMQTKLLTQGKNDKIKFLCNKQWQTSSNEIHHEKLVAKKSTRKA